MSASKQPDSRWIPENSPGFILLEVLVAMSMILGVWISSVGAYQRLALSLAQQEAKRSQLRKELDAFEIQEYGRLNLGSPTKALKNDSTRMPGWNRSVRNTYQSASKDKR